MDYRKMAQEFYLEYVNDYITIEKISEHKNISYELGLALVEFGRKVQNGEA